jgi:hypothetical protein
MLTYADRKRAETMSVNACRIKSGIKTPVSAIAILNATRQAQPYHRAYTTEQGPYLDEEEAVQQLRLLPPTS